MQVPHRSGSSATAWEYVGECLRTLAHKRGRRSTLDPRAGGRFRFVQRAPDCREHAFHGVYREVDRPQRLVRTFVYVGAPDDESVETVTFQCDGRGTLITSASVFPSFSAREFYAQGGMEVGLRESHQRLDEWLEAIRNETNRRQ